MVLSVEGEARYEPSGDHAMRFIVSVCPRRTWRRVRTGTGEPPISVKVAGCGSFRLREDLVLGAGFGCTDFRLAMCVSPWGGVGDRVRLGVVGGLRHGRG